MAQHSVAVSKTQGLMWSRLYPALPERIGCFFKKAFVSKLLSKKEVSHSDHLLSTLGINVGGGPQVSGQAVGTTCFLQADGLSPEPKATFPLPLTHVPHLGRTDSREQCLRGITCLGSSHREVTPRTIRPSNCHFR